MHSGSPSDSQGPVSTQGSPWESYSNSSNQNVFLTKVVRYDEKNPLLPVHRDRYFVLFFKLDGIFCIVYETLSILQTTR